MLVSGMKNQPVWQCFWFIPISIISDLSICFKVRVRASDTASHPATPFPSSWATVAEDMMSTINKFFSWKVFNIRNKHPSGLINVIKFVAYSLWAICCLIKTACRLLHPSSLLLIYDKGAKWSVMCWWYRCNVLLQLAWSRVAVNGF